jgi:hypothetical protein
MSRWRGNYLQGQTLWEMEMEITGPLVAQFEHS